MAITDYFRFRRVALIGLAGLVVLALISAVRVSAQQTPSADEHKAWMNDASDAEEDFRFAGTDKDAKAAAAKGSFADAGAAFDKMTAKCNACHELHLEKR